MLLLDEPLSALDAKVRAELRDQIRALQQRLVITTVFVTHDQEEALSMADRVCVMSRGQARAVRDAGRALLEPATAFVAEFVGVSSRVPSRAPATTVNTLRPGRPDPRRRCRRARGRSTRCCAPRTSDVAVAPDGLGVVTHRSFRGATTRLDVGIGGETVRADVREPLPTSSNSGPASASASTRPTCWSRPSDRWR